MSWNLKGYFHPSQKTCLMADVLVEVVPLPRGGPKTKYKSHGFCGWSSRVWSEDHSQNSLSFTWFSNSLSVLYIFEDIPPHRQTPHTHTHTHTQTPQNNNNQQPYTALVNLYADTCNMYALFKIILRYICVLLKHHWQPYQLSLFQCTFKLKYSTHLRDLVKWQTHSLHKDEEGNGHLHLQLHYSLLKQSLLWQKLVFATRDLTLPTSSSSSTVLLLPSMPWPILEEAERTSLHCTVCQMSCGTSIKRPSLTH